MSDEMVLCSKCQCLLTNLDIRCPKCDEFVGGDECGCDTCKAQDGDVQFYEELSVQTRWLRDYERFST